MRHVIDYSYISPSRKGGDEILGPSGLTRFAADVSVIRNPSLIISSLSPVSLASIIVGPVVILVSVQPSFSAKPSRRTFVPAL